MSEQINSLKKIKNLEQMFLEVKGVLHNKGLNIVNDGYAVTQQDFNKLEQRIGVNVSEEFRFYLLNTCASRIENEIGEKPYFDYQGMHGTDTKKQEYDDRLENIYFPAEVKIHHDPEGWYIIEIAECYSGSLVLSGTGEVSHWAGVSGDLSKVTNSWFEFLSMLYSPEANPLY